MSAYVMASYGSRALAAAPTATRNIPATLQQGSVHIRTDLDIVVARYIARDVARGVGFHPVEQARIATAVSELVHTLVLYAETGHIDIHALTGEQESGIEITIEEHCPGESRLAHVLQETPSVSLQGTLSGLGRVRQLMDSFEVHAQVGSGVRMVCRKLRHESVSG
jgi:serine/threonine-protein kinase RsbT